MYIKSADLAWIMVSDITQARNFFSEKVGLTIMQDAPDYGWMEFSGNDNSILLGVGACPEHTKVINAVITMTVDDIVATKKALEAQGIKFIDEIMEVPDQVKMVSLVDADNNMFQLCQPLNQCNVDKKTATTKNAGNGPIDALGLAWIVVSDLKKAEQFFTMLGFTIAELKAEYGWMEVVGKQGGMRIGVCQYNPNMGGFCKPGQNAVVTMSVKDIVTAKKEMETKGITFVDEITEVPGNVKMISFIDTDNNCFQLCQLLKK